MPRRACRPVTMETPAPDAMFFRGTSAWGPIRRCWACPPAIHRAAVPTAPSPSDAAPTTARPACRPGPGWWRRSAARPTRAAQPPVRRAAASPARRAQTISSSAAAPAAIPPGEQLSRSRSTGAGRPTRAPASRSARGPTTSAETRRRVSLGPVPRRAPRHRRSSRRRPAGSAIRSLCRWCPTTSRRSTARCRS